MEKLSYVYFLTNWHNTVIYIGVTTNLIKRTWQHKTHLVKGFSAKYKLSKLIYYEIFDSIKEAINREKQLKSGSRQQKIILINSMNPDWKDLYLELVNNQ